VKLGAASPVAPVTPARPVEPLHGLIAIDKPTGVTSHDVVEKVRRRLRAPGAGHLGTLDPGASGLLLVAVGAATRCVSVWQGGEKTYEGTLRLGVVTDTQDTSGTVLERREPAVTEDQVRAAALAMTGDLEQVPPMMSALKVRGERLYRLARRGEVVERSPRSVHVAAWEWLSFALPEASFRVRCSGGTYVRTLAHDLGARLGVGAALHALRRLRSEPFGLERSVRLRDLDTLAPEEAWSRGGIPLAEALAPLPRVVLDDAEAEAVGFGGRPVIDTARATAPPASGPRSIVIWGSGGTPLALGELAPIEGDSATLRLCPHVVFPWAVREGRV
jgi:tRNA pseudouridine55 synthase